MRHSYPVKQALSQASVLAFLIIELDAPDSGIGTVVQQGGWLITGLSQVLAIQHCHLLLMRLG